MVVLGIFLASCANNSHTVPEVKYSTTIVGHWQGTVGDLKETMTISADSTFVCKIHPTGFIANTFKQYKEGTISGTWKIKGSMILLEMTSVKNEYLENSITSATIVSFHKDEIVLKSDSGGTTTFQRVRAL